MSYKKLFIHQEKVSVLISQEELTELIVAHVSAKSGINVDKSTVKNIFFQHNDYGTAGFKTSARVELTNEILPPMLGSGNPLPVEY